MSPDFGPMHVVGDIFYCIILFKDGLQELERISKYILWNLKQQITLGVDFIIFNKSNYNRPKLVS